MKSRRRPRTATYRRRAWRRALTPYLLVAPVLTVLLLFFFLPATYNIALSLQKVSLFELGRGGTWIGLDNFRGLLDDPVMGKALVNTALWLTAATVLLRLVLGLGLALLLNSRGIRRSRLSWLARALLILPWATPPVVAVGAWRWLLHERYGFVNQVLLSLGAIDEGIPFMLQPSTVWFGVVATVVWQGLPFVAISVLAGMQAIPESVYEAAAVDGANRRQVFRHITLPLLRPVLGVVGLLTTIWTYNNFVYVWLSTRGGPGNTTQVLATKLYTEAFIDFEFGRGAAVSVVMTAIMVVFALVWSRTVLRKKVGDA